MSFADNLNPFVAAQKLSATGAIIVLAWGCEGFCVQIPSENKVLYGADRINFGVSVVKKNGLPKRKPKVRKSKRKSRRKISLVQVELLPELLPPGEQSRHEAWGESFMLASPCRGYRARSELRESRRMGI